MACYHPIDATRYRGDILLGVHTVGEHLKLPCGQCIGCRLKRAGDWTIRLMQEAPYYQDKCFITLTYNDDHLPADHSLCIPHFQKFIKRLRKANPHSKIRYFMCGEYGEKLSRPHYHAIIYGWSPTDAEPWGHHDGITTYKSDELSDIWGKGFCTVGEVNDQTCGYTARYCMKKVTGDRADEHYFYVDEYGELYDNLQPEYCAMSNGIGERHYREWKDDIYPADEMGIIRGGEFTIVQPPRYYDKLYAKEHPEEFELLKLRRIAQSILNPEDQTPERLEVREYVKHQTTKTLKRKMESCDSQSSLSTIQKQKRISPRSFFRLMKWQHEHSVIASIQTTTNSENILRTTRSTVSEHLRILKARLTQQNLPNSSVLVYNADNLKEFKKSPQRTEQNGEESETYRKSHILNGPQGRDPAVELRPIAWGENNL